MDSTSTLEEKTQAYWVTSSAFRGKNKTGKEINTQTALGTCGKVLLYLGPHRLLFNRMAQLQDSIIVGQPRKKPAHVATVTKLRNAQ